MIRQDFGGERFVVGLVLSSLSVFDANGSKYVVAAAAAAAAGQGCFTPNPLPPFSVAALRCRCCPRRRGCIPICSMQSSPEPDLARNRFAPPPPSAFFPSGLYWPA